MARTCTESQLHCCFFPGNNNESPSLRQCCQPRDPHYVALYDLAEVARSETLLEFRQRSHVCRAHPSETARRRTQGMGLRWSCGQFQTVAPQRSLLSAHAHAALPVGDVSHRNLRDDRFKSMTTSGPTNLSAESRCPQVPHQCGRRNDVLSLSGSPFCSVRLSSQPLEKNYSADVHRSPKGKQQEAGYEGGRIVETANRIITEIFCAGVLCALACAPNWWT
jgi:hypothetical protein